MPRKKDLLLKVIEYIKLGVAVDMSRDEIVEMLAQALDDLFEFKLGLLEAHDKEAWLYVINHLIDLFTVKKVKKHSTILQRVEAMQRQAQNQLSR